MGMRRGDVERNAIVSIGWLGYTARMVGKRMMTLTVAPILLSGLAGCASPIIPEPLEQQIDKSVTFNQVLESPDSYRGRIVLWAGEVLKARALQNGTELEVLQLPVTDYQAPARQRTESKGRFLALNKDFLDPATFTDGTRVTIVGEVTGATVAKLDDTDYRYPTVEVKHLHRWEGRRGDDVRGSGPWWGVFGGVGVGGGARSGGGISIGTGF